MENVIKALRNIHIGRNLLMDTIDDNDRQVISALITDGYIKVNRLGVIESDCVNYNALTDHEIVMGTDKGKIHAVKSYKLRSGYSLVESKQRVEKYFADNGLKFWQDSY